MTSVAPLFYAVLILQPIIFFYSPQLKIMELGEESATSLGIETNKTRAILIICAVFLVAMATAVTGPISLVSFLSGPISKRIAGSWKSNIIIAGLFGSLLVLSADIMGQFAFKSTLPVGVITGLLGAPYLIILLVKMNRKGTF